MENGTVIGMRHIIGIALALVFFSSCGLLGPKIDGTFKKGIYEAPNRIFAVPRPDGIVVGMGDEIQDEVEGDSGIVSFIDVMGNLFRVIYMKRDPSSPFWAHEDDGEQALSQYQEQFMWMFEQGGVEISEVHQEDTTVGERAALYLEFAGKGASHVGPSDWRGRQKSRLEASVSSISFIEGDYLFHVSRQWTSFSQLTGTEGEDDRTPEEKAEQKKKWTREAVQELKRFAESITFPAGPSKLDE